MLDSRVTELKRALLGEVRGRPERSVSATNKRTTNAAYPQQASMGGTVAHVLEGLRLAVIVDFVGQLGGASTLVSNFG